jgi:hypothetical protein
LQIKPKEKCVITQKPPITENRKENTHKPHLPNIEKKKLWFASPFQKKKILGLSFEKIWMGK